MNWVKIKEGNGARLVNLNYVIEARFDESQFTLRMELSNGQFVEMIGREAVDVWELLLEYDLLLDIDDNSLENDSEDNPIFENDTEESNGFGDLIEIEKEITDLRNRTQVGVVFSDWDGQKILNRIGNMLSPMFRSLPKTKRIQLEKLRIEAEEVSKAASLVAYRNKIKECQGAIFTNQPSIKKVIREILEVENSLINLGELNEDLAIQIRGARERAAWYRAKKKLGESQVASAGGNLVKAEKFRQEAKILLQQDWIEIFPGEAIPDFVDQ